MRVASQEPKSKKKKIFIACSSRSLMINSEHFYYNLYRFLRVRILARRISARYRTVCVHGKREKERGGHYTVLHIHWYIISEHVEMYF